MFCPKCGTEYRAGFKTCSDCGVDLVATRPTPKHAADAHDREEPAVPAWRGDDPVAFSAAFAALEEAEIPARQVSLHEQFTGIFAVQPPEYEIVVHPDNLARAKDVIRKALELDTSE